jgi:signal recognition particle GTPase
MDYAKWANENKKRIAREFIRKTGFQSKEKPAGVFTAGLPGAGKTEFTIELLKYLIDKPLRIYMDEIATLIDNYRPEIADKFRVGASAILARIYDEILRHKIDFVFRRHPIASPGARECRARPPSWLHSKDILHSPTT